MQEFLGSMEGAVFSGKLAARAIAQDYSSKINASSSKTHGEASLAIN
jgi:15-cis-phytoene desaturase